MAVGSCTSTNDQLELVTGPPGVLFVTVMVPAVAVATSEARISASTSCPETKVVARACRFQFTTELEVKLAPNARSVNAPLPGTTACGLGGPITCATGNPGNFAGPCPW